MRSWNQAQAASQTLPTWLLEPLLLPNDKGQVRRRLMTTWRSIICLILHTDGGATLSIRASAVVAALKANPALSRNVKFRKKLLSPACSQNASSRLVQMSASGRLWEEIQLSIKESSHLPPDFRIGTVAPGTRSSNDPLRRCLQTCSRVQTLWIQQGRLENSNHHLDLALVSQPRLLWSTT